MDDGEDSPMQLHPADVVSCDPAAARPLPAAPVALDDLPVHGTSRGDVTLADVLDVTSTDGWLVLHEGAVVAEHYPAGLQPEATHSLMSITKSVVGAVAGILAEQGVFAPGDPITRYVGELAASGYRRASIQDVLDMRSGVRFREDYEDPDSHVRRMEAAADLHTFLCGLQADRRHGGHFEYRSSETDVLGWVCERASGRRLADIIAETLWKPMGAEHDATLLCDAAGNAWADGGLSATARDTARFGQLLLEGGAYGGRQVLPRRWLADVWSVNPEVRAAYAASPAEQTMPGGWYRNQCWVFPGPHGDILAALGVYGQLLRVDPATRTVMVKLSSWQTPTDAANMFDTLLACDAVAAALAGRAGKRDMAPVRRILT